MKAIVATEIRAGDTVRIREKVVLAVQATELKNTFTYEYHPKVRIIPRLGESVEVDADAIVELLRRPWPEGENESDMLDLVERLTERFSLARELSQQDVQKVATALREAIEAYELGKPLLEKPGQNESLIDRHMMP